MRMGKIDVRIQVKADGRVVYGHVSHVDSWEDVELLDKYINQWCDEVMQRQLQRSAMRTLAQLIDEGLILEEIAKMIKRDHLIRGCD